jgi:hypothetical protein
MYINLEWEQGNASPRIGRIKTDATLVQVTTAGFLNGAVSQGIAIQPSDKFEIYYGIGGTPANAFFDTSITAGVVTLSVAESNVVLPVVSGNFAVFSGTSGALADLGYLPSNAAKTTVVMAGSAVQSGYMAKFVDTAGTLDDTAGAAINAGNIQAGLSGTAGTFISYPTTAANGSFIWAAVGNAGNFAATVSPKSTLGQASVYTIPDPGAATANFVLDAGNATSISVLNLKYGATPVAQVDPASCTITAAAGAANTSTITIQLKDGSGTNMARIIPFRVYSSSAADGLTLQSAASTGYSVASGGLSLNNGAAITTQISAISSATGGCVLSLLDTGKLTSYLVLVLSNGTKISAQLSAGSYG